RLILPTFVIVLVLAMSSAYVVARSLPSSTEMSRVNTLLTTGDLISQRATRFYENQQALAEQLAQLPELNVALQSGSADELNTLLENYARRSELDSVILTNSQGNVITALVRG